MCLIFFFSRLEHLDDSESEEDEAGIFKPASHRQVGSDK